MASDRYFAELDAATIHKYKRTYHVERSRPSRATRTSTAFRSRTSPPAARLHRQNLGREDAVPASVVKKMMEWWEVPDAAEAHTVTWVFGLVQATPSEAPRQ